MEPAGRSGPSSYSTSQQDSFFAQAAHVSPDLAELGGAPDTYFGYQEKGETKLVVFTTQGDKTYIIKPNGGGCTVQEGMFPKNYATLDAFLNTFSPKPTYKLPDPFEASQQFLKSHIWVERDVKTLMGGACAVRTTKKGYELPF